MKRGSSYCLCLMMAIIIALQPVLNASAERYYAGYYYKGSPGATGTGVAAYILTVHRSVSGNKFHARWPTIVMSYSLDYFVQVGYRQGYLTSNTKKYYIEKNDTYGYAGWWRTPEWGSPSTGTWYRYFIYQYTTTQWKIGVTGQGWNYCTTNPCCIADYQAFCETNNDTINIDGTAFNYLEYKVLNDWRLWDRKLVRDDANYVVTEIFDYAFNASGGS